MGFFIHPLSWGFLSEYSFCIWLQSCGPEVIKDALTVFNCEFWLVPTTNTQKQGSQWLKYLNCNDKIEDTKRTKLMNLTIRPIAKLASGAYTGLWPVTSAETINGRNAGDEVVAATSMNSFISSQGHLDGQDIPSSNLVLIGWTNALQPLRVSQYSEPGTRKFLIFLLYWP